MLSFECYLKRSEEIHQEIYRMRALRPVSLRLDFLGFVLVEVQVFNKQNENETSLINQSNTKIKSYR